MDPRKWIQISELTEEQLKEVIQLAMFSMSGKEISMECQERTIPKEQELGPSIDVELVRSCLYNWLGYGNVNAPIWFLGIEEGGAEIWRNKTKTLEESLNLRSEFNLQMDFRYVWEELYEIPLESFRGANVWRFMVAFLLEWEGKPSDPKAIHDFICTVKKLGRDDANHFFGELMPLPKPSKGKMEPYESIWPTSQNYYEEVGEKRFSLIRETIVENLNVQLIVSYDQVLTEKFMNFSSFIAEEVDGWQYKEESYSLYKITITDERSIYLLATPFFGYGRISYDGIKDAANRILNLMKAG